MDDERPYMWTHFMMEDEMSTIIILPLEGGSLSFIVVAPPLLQLPIVKQCQKRKKIGDDETNVPRKWSDVIFVNIFNLYEKKWKCLDKSCLSFKHWTHICIEHHCHLLDECCHKQEQFLFFN
jgi:hypothetical protein